MRISELVLATAEVNRGDARRIAHFMKVYAYARTIGMLEGLSPEDQAVLEAAAVVHDIGIRSCEEKYGSAAGHLQQVEGPPIARAIMLPLGFPEEMVERVCWLVAHHHTYVNITPGPYRILVEADFLVNLEEEGTSAAGIANVRDNMFVTAPGLQLLDTLFSQEQDHV